MAQDLRLAGGGARGPAVYMSVGESVYAESGGLALGVSDSALTRACGRPTHMILNGWLMCMERPTYKNPTMLEDPVPVNFYCKDGHVTIN